MEKTGFKVVLIVVFLGFSCLLISCVAVPATRSIESNTELLPASVQDLLAQNVRKSGETEEIAEDYLSTQDYPRTGASTKHDPRDPLPLPDL
ncbi:hypothetical protein V6N13_131486 [Hibiscus sabdariffa]|uniref:Uncharacterized protein n=1 Tax=Hibiscus sabdariffa TaxID=183260 RepID=A0ABR2D8U6_9ROSI